MTPAGTSNELDVQNEWEENTHTQYIIEHFHVFGREVVGAAIYSVLKKSIKRPNNPEWKNARFDLSIYLWSWTSKIQYILA